MIEHTAEMKMQQSRDSRHQYRDINDPKFFQDYGKPVQLIPGREVHLDLEIHLVYDQIHAPLVNNLVQAVIAINKVIMDERQAKI